jgi:hypothetical protein
MRTDVIPLLEAIGNSNLLSLDLSGHQVGDTGAAAIGRLLQTNSKLVSLEVDENAFSLEGFKRIREGLLRNTTLQHFPIPVSNIIALRSGMSTQATVGKRAGLPSQEVLNKVIRDIEARMSENYSKNKDKNDGRKKKPETPLQEVGFRFVV